MKSCIKNYIERKTERYHLNTILLLGTAGKTDDYRNGFDQSNLQVHLFPKPLSPYKLYK